MRPEDVPGFIDKPGRRIEPLGGREADGFGYWLSVTIGQMEEAVKSTSALGADTPSARLCRDAYDHYVRIIKMFGRARDGVTEHSRDLLETELIHDVIVSHAWAAYARERSTAGLPDDGERIYLQMSSAYLRSILILATYVGVDQLTVGICQGDQDALLTLVNTRGDL
jgi:hypothetical protein